MAFGPMKLALSKLETLDGTFLATKLGKGKSCLICCSFSAFSIRLSFALRFWNQILIWLSVKSSNSANWNRLLRLMYSEIWYSISRRSVCPWVKVVLCLRWPLSPRKLLTDAVDVKGRSNRRRWGESKVQRGNEQERKLKCPLQIWVTAICKRNRTGSDPCWMSEWHNSPPRMKQSCAPPAPFVRWLLWHWKASRASKLQSETPVKFKNEERKSDESKSLARVRRASSGLWQREYFRSSITAVLVPLAVKWAYIVPRSFIILTERCCWGHCYCGENICSRIQLVMEMSVRWKWWNFGPLPPKSVWETNQVTPVARVTKCGHWMWRSGQVAGRGTK